MEAIVKIAQDYGALGLIILACFWYIVKKDGDHKDERKEVMDALAQQHKEALEVTKNNTTVLTEIATLIRRK